MKQDVDIVMKCQEIKDKDQYYMSLALKEAKKAALIDEIPIGCVIVKDDHVLVKAHNLREKKQSALGHAELIAIDKANKKLNTWILDDCTIYVTLEPCTMCAGAILQARMKRVVFGAHEPKFGSCGSVINVLNNPNFNHQVEVKESVLEEECSQILKNFFQKLRQKVK